MKRAAIQGWIIDMDGVLYRGGTALPGMVEFITLLRAKSLPFVIVTNNATSTPEAVVQKLAGMGGSISPQEVLSSALATATWLKGELPSGAAIYVIGEEGLRAALSEAGFRLASAADGARAVVVGMDRKVTWEKMAEGALAIGAGAMFVGTNPDPSFPVERGLVPGNGAILAALQATTDVAPKVIGKPEVPLFLQAAERIGLEPAHIMVLGDRLSTDILGGQRAGMQTALMLTGVTDRETLEASSIHPDRVYRDLQHLMKDIWEGQN
jgi:4-nitrophenyl phosphatase